DAQPYAVVESGFFLGIAEHHRALIGLPDRDEQMIQERFGPLGHYELAALRPYRRLQSYHGREARVADAGGQHQFLRADRGTRVAQKEDSVVIVDRVHDMARPVLRAEQVHPHMESLEQAQRIALAVDRTKAGAYDLRPDVRQALEERIAVQHLVGIADHVRLIVQALEHASTGLQLRLGERQGEATRPRERHVDARGLLEL